MSKFLLVHGSGHGAWCFEKLANDFPEFITFLKDKIAIDLHKKVSNLSMIEL